MGRPRIHESNAARQKAYRQRQREKLESLQSLLEAQYADAARPASPPKPSKPDGGLFVEPQPRSSLGETLSRRFDT